MLDNNLKEARLSSELRVVDVCNALDITKATLISWEKGSTLPTANYLKDMAKLYNTSIDYLLSNDGFFDIFTTLEVKEKEALALLHGKPVYSDAYGWLIVNATEKIYVNGAGDKIPFDEVAMPIYLRQLNNEPIRVSKALKYSDLSQTKEVLVEPIGYNKKDLYQLRGYYFVYAEEHFVENDRGNRFFFDSYGSSWLAFDI